MNGMMIIFSFHSKIMKRENRVEYEKGRRETKEWEKAKAKKNWPPRESQNWFFAIQLVVLVSLSSSSPIFFFSPAVVYIIIIIIILMSIIFPPTKIILKLNLNLLSATIQNKERDFYYLIYLAWRQCSVNQCMSNPRQSFKSTTAEDDQNKPGIYDRIVNDLCPPSMLKDGQGTKTRTDLKVKQWVKWNADYYWIKTE